MEVLLAAAFGVAGVVAGSIVTGRLAHAGEILAIRRERLEQFARLAYEHHRDVRAQVAARLGGEEYGHLRVGDTEEMSRIRAALVILAPGPCAKAATALLEHSVAIGGVFVSGQSANATAWDLAIREYGRRLEAFEAEAAKAAGAGPVARWLWGL